MKITIHNKKGVPIQPGMMGLFFEDINYAADGGLYAEMIENRSFEFLEAEGSSRDYYTHYDGGFGWAAYPDTESLSMRTVMGSPLAEENPHYMRVETKIPMSGLSNQGYEGICLKKDMEYHVAFWARSVRYGGKFCAWVEKDGVKYTAGVWENTGAPVSIEADAGMEETWNFYRRYELTLKALETVQGARFVLCLEEPGVAEFDFISMFPADAVAGIFRKDLFEMLEALRPGFLRFPGGCIVEGNTLANRYRYKDSLKPLWARRNNWNRWAVHNNCAENGYHGAYSHYNQTLGLGYYEYFLLCEMIGAKPLPVLNVGFACQYQSEELVPVDSPQFQEFLQDAVDLLEFANGSVDTKWGGLRAAMGHSLPFGLEMLGIGNEQWQTEKADFFERYTIFEKVIHDYDPAIRLIGSAGPDITSERYTAAWNFYNGRKQEENFVYAVDEHYYVKPRWFLEHTDFYDNYPREIKVFSGEYAAHPVSGMNLPQANTLEGALAEAAFLTGMERNADVVVLASYAPLFARLGYAQWSPDMIWFDGQQAYGTPSYYVQKMYSCNMGTVTLDTEGGEKEAAAEGIYYSLSQDEGSGEIIVKVVNSRGAACRIELELAPEWGKRERYCMQLLTGDAPEACNCLEHPTNIVPKETEGPVAGDSVALELPAYSFAVMRIS